MERNGLTEKEAASRVNSQMSLDEKKKLSSQVFDNNGDKKELYNQIDEFVKILENQ